MTENSDRRDLKTSWKRAIASLLVVAMVFTSTSLDSLAATFGNDMPDAEKVEDVNGGDFSENNVIDKDNVIVSENTESSTTYDAGNGILITEFYSQDVRFRDANGELIDYDASLIEVEDEYSELGNVLESYVYENKDGDKKQYFPENLTSETPVLMENDSYQIHLSPVEVREKSEMHTNVHAREFRVETPVSEIQMNSVEMAPAELKMEKTEDIYEEEKIEPIKTSYESIDENVKFQYTSLDNGIKEEIILDEKPEQNMFSFVLEIPSLTMRKNMSGEGFTIYNGDEIVAGVAEPCMNDATGQAYSEDVTCSLKILDEEAGKYGITITVDDAYLNSNARVYPVSVDTSFTWQDGSKLSETYALSKPPYDNYNFYVEDITSFYLGSGSQGISRAFMEFASLELIRKRYVEDARLVFRECSNSAAGNIIQAFQPKEYMDLGAINWYNQPIVAGGVVGTMVTKGPNQYCEMNLTELFRSYAKDPASNKGLIFRNANENGSMSKFYGTRHASVNYRPKLTVTHYPCPAKAVSVKLTPEYVKPGQTTKIEWTGITGQDLSYVQYYSAEYDEKSQSVIAVETPYSVNSKIGTTANGSADITVGKSVASGAYKTYKVAVRGVGANSGIGEEHGKFLKVDNAVPKGNIKVLASGTAQETDILRDTVEIVGEVDGTGSPIKTSSMKLYDSEGKFVQDIYTNSTLSKIQCVFTPELPNGSYTLKLTMEDTVGFTSEVEKTIRIVNRLSAPVIKTVLSNQGNVDIEWEFTYASTEIAAIAYKLPGSVEWNKVENISGTKGKLAVTLPDEEGTYDVTVCGVDETGGMGEPAIAKCVIDKTMPTAEISKTDRGMVFGTIGDTNLSKWTLILEDPVNGGEETVLQGTKSIEDGYIGLFDMSTMVPEIVYKLWLKVYDKAGNKSEISTDVKIREEDILPEEIKPVFRVKRPAYASEREDHIVFPENISRIELLKWHTAEDIPTGTTRWYCDGNLVCSEKTWSSNLPKMEQVTHSILVAIENEGSMYYSRSIIQNKGVVGFLQGETIQLPEGCVAFRLKTGDEVANAQILLDGQDMSAIVSNRTVHITQTTNGKKVTASSLKVTPVDVDADTSKWYLEFDCVDEETFEVSKMENYHPYELSIKDKLNYKTYLKWNGISGEWPKEISYEIYRGQESGFIPSTDNLIASDVKANYWAEMNVNYSGTFYYRIRAVEKNEDGKVVRKSSFSFEISSTVIDADEYVKRLGLKEYWEYAEFDTPSGEGAIEKSKGNFVYTQKDTEIPNEQLPVVLERTYNSQSSEKTAFGVGWTHSFDMELLNICKNDSLEFKNIVLKDGNGTLYFYNQKEDGSYVSSMGKYTQLKKEEKTEEVELPEKEIGVKDKTKKVKVISSFTMTTKDNVQYRFNSGGQLIYMSEANGNFLLFEYEPNKGLLSKITTSKNLTMEFTYYTENDFQVGKALPDLLTVKEIRLPDGSKVSYEYTDARLSSVIKTGKDKTSTLQWNLTYNENKQLTGISDAIGNIYQVGYDGKKANRITYPNGDAIVLEYDDDTQKTIAHKEVTEKGETERIFLETNTFDISSGNGIQMVDCLGNSTTYEYTDNLLSKTTYSMTYQEMEENRVVEKTTEKTETAKYSSRENMKEEVDEDGIKSIYTYDENAPKNLVDLPVGYREISAEGYVITDETYMYDSNGNVIRSYDAIDDRVVETTYYEADDPATGKIKGEIKSEREYFLKDSENQISTDSTYTYDADGNKTVVMTEKAGKIGADGKEESVQSTVTTTTVYDVMGREISSEDSLGTSTTTEYDPFGRVCKIIVKQGNITDIVTREYDANGALVKEVEEDGTVYTYTFDEMNRLIKEGIEKDGISKIWTTDYTYGSVTVHTAKGLETVDHVLITTEKNPDGVELAVTYTDTLGRIIRQKKKGLYADYAYDRENHVIASFMLGTNSNNLSPVITAYLFDKGGNASGQIVNAGYDEDTQTFTVKSDSLTQSKVYDSTGNVISVTDGEGNTTSYTYDANGRVISVTEPEISGKPSAVTKYEYDKFDPNTKNGNTMNIVTDALGRKSVTTYNMTMQPISISDQGDGTTAPIQLDYIYDSKRRVSEEKDSLGTSRTYEYDGKDRVKTVHYKNASGSEELRTCYTYNKSDQVTMMLDYTVNGTTATLYRYTEYQYDRLKRITAQTELNTNKALSDITTEEKEAHTIRYSYDIDGNLMMVTYPETEWNVKALRFRYSYNKWLENVYAVLKDEKMVRLQDYYYDEYGSVSQITNYRSLSKTGEVVYPIESTVCKYTYDACRRPGSVSYYENSNLYTPKEQHNYGYDKNSHLIHETIENSYPDYRADCQFDIRTYEYDARGNLTHTEVQNLLNTAETYDVSYTYDAVGNRLSQEKNVTVGGTEITQYIYNGLNQLMSSVTKTQDGALKEDKTYGYDANGNQTRENESVGAKEILSTYDSAGRLSTWTMSDHGKMMVQQQNKYNGSGIRIQKTENEAVTNYFYDRDSVLYTEDGTGKGTSLNLCGLSGDVIATGRNKGAVQGYYYYHRNAAGSTTNLRDAEGAAVVSYRYTDFGETEIVGDAGFYNEICYNGAIYDKSTGLYYLNARYYNPADGRFMSRDSYRGNISDPSTMHLYVYCANNPLNYEDPSGHIAISRIVGGIIGGAIGAYRGYKVAKKKGYTGWKKVRAIAGRAVVGGVVGAVAGPRVAKVAKKTVWYVKRKLPVRSVKIRASRPTIRKTNSGAVKKSSKVRQVISKGKSTSSGMSNKVQSNSSQKTVKGFEKWLNKGEANNKVYHGIKQGKAQYTGITKQTKQARLYQHNRTGKEFEDLEIVYKDLTRNQARSIEQYFIGMRNGPNQLNKINSISPNNIYFEDALDWANKFVALH